jgi:hypothetical protein
VRARRHPCRLLPSPTTRGIRTADADAGTDGPGCSIGFPSGAGRRRYFLRISPCPDTVDSLEVPQLRRARQPVSWCCGASWLCCSLLLSGAATLLILHHPMPVRLKANLSDLDRWVVVAKEDLIARLQLC